VFLFDEPLSNLDAKLRVQMRTEIKELQQRLQTTSIYVTHDQIEAMTMADRMVVMRDGNIEQIGDPLEVYDRPVNTFVAGFIGSPAMNFIEGTLRLDNGAARVVTEDGTVLPVAAPGGAGEGETVIYGIRPEHFTLTDAGEGLPAEVVVIEPTGAEIIIVCRFAGTEIQALFHERHSMRPGQPIALAPVPEAAHLFDRDSGARLS